jgi:hypothetical protein
MNPNKKNMKNFINAKYQKNCFDFGKTIKFSFLELKLETV